MTTLPIRDDLIGLTPYGAPQLSVPVRLNVNENPFPPSPELVEDIAQSVRQVARDLNRYPDRDALALRRDLAKFICNESSVDITEENVWAANGSNEIMLQLLQLFGGPGRTLVTFAPTYSMYADYCRDTFTDYSEIHRNEDFSIDTSALDNAIALNPTVIVITSPNNPTGTVLPIELVEYLCTRFEGVVIVDEAYAEFRAEGTASAVSLVQKYPRLVVTRTMSKAFSCAGLRLGYALSSPEIISAIQLVRLPYHLSAVTQAVARTALEHSTDLLGQVALIRAERELLRSWLLEHGFEVAPSEANFLLLGRFTNRDAIWSGLLAHGVLVRQVGPEGWLRVTIGTPEENVQLRTALLAVVGDEQSTIEKDRT